MTYLQRIDYRPSMEGLKAEEEEYLRRHLNAYGAEMIVDGQAIRWEHIDEVEVVVAPHASGIGGWLVKNLFMAGQDRYHVGIYYGSHEAVLPNITWNVARYVVESIAFYAPRKILYTGPETLVKLSEI